MDSGINPPFRQQGPAGLTGWVLGKDLQSTSPDTFHRQ